MASKDIVLETMKKAGTPLNAGKIAGNLLINPFYITTH
ncbi:hypothetical protein SAMN05444375_10170 [Segatella baroniae B14]|jgi:hypothetical protein|nr:hypothetical protein SAMN04487899_1143 [Segatella bryantii]SDZ87800.1 hypothetical protein SAMN05216455_101682 [Segatella bryantii]SEP55090.1 hypothetical protein SAMN05444375_10170 [Segatella baroniae B14]